MTLFITHDGKYGWQKDDDAKVRWFDTEFSAKMFGACSHDLSDEDTMLFANAFDDILLLMRTRNHMAAEFNEHGGFVRTRGYDS
jgi:hypothetical protein